MAINEKYTPSGYIPEFPSWTPLLITLVAALTVTVIYRHSLHKQNFKEIVLIVIGFGCWHLSGTEYMNTLIVGDEIQLAKVLPVVFGSAVILGIIIYMYFGKSD